MAVEIKPSNNTNPDVQIIKSISVYPKSSTTATINEPMSQIVSLSNLDRQCPDLMYMVFFYKASDQDLSFESVFDRLKAGLEAVLSVYHLAAGRLRLSSPNNLDIWCNNDGAVLVQAESNGVKICELGDVSMYSEFFEKLVFKPVLNGGNTSDMPLVTAQVTKFDCGGCSVGTGTSHSLFDGISAYEFLTAWAAYSQGSETIMPKPVHGRGALLLENNHELSSTDRIPTSIHHLYQLISQVSPDDQQSQERLVFNTFHLNAPMVENLKINVLKDKKHADLSFSTFELLAAHIWKVRTKTLGFERDRKVCLQFAVDVRKRMVPPLAKGFSGNAYVLASVLSTAREVEENSYECIINQIKEAKSSVTHEYVHAYIAVLQGPQATLPSLPELTVVSDWTRAPFHKISFSGEHAIYASPLIPPVAQVAYLMQNPKECTLVDVRIGLPPDIKDSFSHQFINIL